MISVCFSMYFCPLKTIPGSKFAYNFRILRKVGVKIEKTNFSIIYDIGLVFNLLFFVLIKRNTIIIFFFFGREVLVKNMEIIISWRLGKIWSIWNLSPSFLSLFLFLSFSSSTTEKAIDWALIELTFPCLRW